jgi:hypothetical protein
MRNQARLGSEVATLTVASNALPPEAEKAMGMPQVREMNSANLHHQFLQW